MSLDKIEGVDNLYVGSIWALRRPKALAERNITSVLSVVGFRPTEIEDNTQGTPWSEYRKKCRHMVIDIDDMDDEDLLIHLPEAVRFIEEGLYPGKKKATASGDADATASSESEEEKNDNITPPTDDLAKLKVGSEEEPRGAVYVHCAMGKSRSVSAVVAYLLWKYPQRFGRSAASAADSRSAKGGAREAVKGAIEWVKRSRAIAEPNWGFYQQLQMWWEMGCPADVKSHPIYRRWEYKREIDRSVACGMAPELRFEDEAPPGPDGKEEGGAVRGGEGGMIQSATSPSEGPELRCRKCRTQLATTQFIVALDHGAEGRAKAAEQLAPVPSPCPHYFIEPLSWMRPTLERGELEGRLTCPNDKCGASVGRYSWRGFQCSCGEWVTPAFSLQKARVDVVVKAVRRPGTFGIRMPPGGVPKENL